MITQNIHVRMDAYGIPPVIHAVEGDTWRYLDIYTDDAAINTSNTAVVAIHRPDDSYYTISATPDVSGFYHLEMDQALTRPGKVECQLKVSSGDLIISTYTFYIIVEPSTTGLPVEQLGYDIYDLIAAAGTISGSGLTDDIKQALLDCFEHVAWTDEHGQDYVDALEAALYPPAELASISAVYTQSGTVYDTDTLDSLKSDLVVTAHYDDSSSSVVTTYTLSGTLTEGTSTITVTYGGKTTSFNVTVTERLTSISAVYTQSGAVYDDATLNDLKADLVVTAHYADSTTETVTDYTLSGTLTVGTSTITVSYWGKTTTFTVTVSKSIDYTDNPLADVTWYDGYTYNSSGAMVTAANEHCTSKFDAQTCIYALANSDTSANSYVTIFAWDENDVYLGGPGNNNTGRWMLKEGYKYAIKMYGANANKNAISLMPVDNRATAVPSFEINLSDYVESIVVAGSFYELSVGSILAENGIESSNWDTAINSVNSLCRIDYGYTAAARGIPFDDDFAFGFYTHTTMYMRAKSVGSNNLSGLKNYITQNNIKVRFNS